MLVQNLDPAPVYPMSRPNGIVRKQCFSDGFGHKRWWRIEGMMEQSSCGIRWKEADYEMIATQLQSPWQCMCYPHCLYVSGDIEWFTKITGRDCGNHQTRWDISKWYHTNEERLQDSWQDMLENMQIYFQTLNAWNPYTQTLNLNALPFKDMKPNGLESMHKRRYLSDRTVVKWFSHKVEVTKNVTIQKIKWSLTDPTGMTTIKTKNVYDWGIFVDVQLPKYDASIARQEQALTSVIPFNDVGVKFESDLKLLRRLKAAEYGTPVSIRATVSYECREDGVFVRQKDTDLLVYREDHASSVIRGIPLTKLSANGRKRKAAMMTKSAMPPGQCVVCMDAVVTHAMIPCGHLCVCSACADVLDKTVPCRCPKCRTAVRSINKIFVE